MDADRLKSIPLFAELSDRERKQIAQWSDEVQVAAGEHLVNEGAFAHEFFVIEEGEAEVRRGEDHLANLGPGDFFGEIALLEQEKRTATVVANSPMILIVMFGRDFRQMESILPGVAGRIRGAIEERIRR